LKNALYIPKLRTNLFSASKAATNGRKILLTENTAVILNKKGQVDNSQKEKWPLFYRANFRFH